MERAEQELVRKLIAFDEDTFDELEPARKKPKARKTAA